MDQWQVFCNQPSLWQSKKKHELKTREVKWQACLWKQISDYINIGCGGQGGKKIIHDEETERKTFLVTSNHTGVPTNFDTEEERRKWKRALTFELNEGEGRMEGKANQKVKKGDNAEITVSKTHILHTFKYIKTNNGVMISMCD